jgi:hypothetical protein
MDNQGPCQCPPPDAPTPGGVSARLTKIPDFRRFLQLARLMLLLPHQGFQGSGRGKMDKFEALAFAVGFIATGFLTFVASMPIA